MNEKSTTAVTSSAVVTACRWVRLGGIGWCDLTPRRLRRVEAPDSSLLFDRRHVGPTPAGEEIDLFLHYG